MDASQAAQGSTAAQPITVQYGPYKEVLPLSGKTASEVRKLLEGKWSIDASATAYIGKQAISNETIITPGQHVSFLRVQGEKGICI